MAKSLEERIQIIEDQQEIAKLKARYVNLNDGGWKGPTHTNPQAVADMFVEDGVWDGRPSTGYAQGRAEIKQLFEAFGAVPFIVHYVTNPIIEVDGDTATGHWHAMVTMTVPGDQALWSLGLYGFVIWLPSILKVSGMGMVELGWLSALPYLAALIVEFLNAAWSDKHGRRKIAMWPSLVIGALAFYGSYALGASHFWLSFSLLVIAGAAMYAPYGPFFAYLAETLPSNVAGGAIALINSMGALGSFAGAYGVGLLNGATGNPGMSYLFMAAGLIAAAAITFFLPERRTI